jgi:hypothetical protein
VIYKLQESEYQRVRPVFEGLRYNLVIDCGGWKGGIRKGDGLRCIPL